MTGDGHLFRLRSSAPILFPILSVARPVAIRIVLRAPIRPTEDPAKVSGALERLFPGAEVTVTEDEASATAPSLERLRELIRSQRIPDSARGAMLAGLSEDGLSTRFLLGKQAAAVGRPHFGPLRSPLGDIAVSIFGEASHEVETLIYQTAPDTTVEPELAQVPPALRPEP